MNPNAAPFEIRAPKTPEHDQLASVQGKEAQNISPSSLAIDSSMIALDSSSQASEATIVPKLKPIPVLESDRLKKPKPKQDKVKVNKGNHKVNVTKPVFMKISLAEKAQLEFFQNLMELLQNSAIQILSRYVPHTCNNPFILERSESTLRICIILIRQNHPLFPSGRVIFPDTEIDSVGGVLNRIVKTLEDLITAGKKSLSIHDFLDVLRGSIDITYIWQDADLSHYLENIHWRVFQLLEKAHTEEPEGLQLAITNYNKECSAGLEFVLELSQPPSPTDEDEPQRENPVHEDQSPVQANATVKKEPPTTPDNQNKSLSATPTRPVPTQPRAHINRHTAQWMYNQRAPRPRFYTQQHASPSMFNAHHPMSGPMYHVHQFGSQPLFHAHQFASQPSTHPHQYPSRPPYHVHQYPEQPFHHVHHFHPKP